MGCCDEDSPPGAHEAREAAEEEAGDAPEVYYVGAHIDGDGIHTDHSEDDAPFAKTTHVYYPVEQGEHSQGIGRADQHEGTAPEVLVHREPDVPQKAEPKADTRGGQQISHFATAGELLAADELAGEHTEHRSDHSGDVAEQALRVEVATIEHSQAEDTVHIAHDVAVLGERTGGGIRSGNQRDKGPVAHQQDSRYYYPPAARAADEQYGRQHPGYADTPEDAIYAKVSEIQLEEAVHHYSQQHQDDAAGYDFQVYTACASPLFPLLGIRERERYSGDEKEQREYGVHKGEPVPPGVLHMVVKRTVRSARNGLAESLNQGRNAHDYQHVEPSQGVKGEKSFGSIHNVLFVGGDEGDCGSFGELLGYFHLYRS